VIADAPVIDRRRPHHLAAPLPEDVDAPSEQASAAAQASMQPAGGGA
jgi:hypothetical protein